MQLWSCFCDKWNKTCHDKMKNVVTLNHYQRSCWINNTWWYFLYDFIVFMDAVISLVLFRVLINNWSSICRFLHMSYQLLDIMLSWWSTFTLIILKLFISGTTLNLWFHLCKLYLAIINFCQFLIIIYINFCRWFIQKSIRNNLCCIYRHLNKFKIWKLQLLFILDFNKNRKIKGN